MGKNSYNNDRTFRSTLTLSTAGCTHAAQRKSKRKTYTTPTVEIRQSSEKGKVIKGIERRHKTAPWE